MFGIIETVATAVLLVLLMIFFLHMLRGDSLEWLKAKFTIAAPVVPPNTGPYGGGSGGDGSGNGGGGAGGGF